MKQLCRLVETIIAFALCNFALSGYLVFAQEIPVVGTQWTGIALLVTAILSGVGALMTPYLAYRLTKMKAMADKTNEKLDEVHKVANSLSERLEASSEEKGRQIGVQQGVAQQVAEDALVAKGVASVPVAPTPVTVTNPEPVPVVETKKP